MANYKSLEGYGTTLSLAADLSKEFVLDENRILPTSQPHFEVWIGNIGNTGIGKIELIPYDMIKEATVEGKTPINRKGDIKLVDPESRLPNILITIGAENNSLRNRQRDNILIRFGWRGLKATDKRDTTIEIGELRGVILKSEFDVGEDGVMTCNIHYVETATSILNQIRFFNPDDMAILHNSTGNMNVGEKLQFIFNPNGRLSFHKDILLREYANPKIYLEAESTDDDKDKAIDVNFGDYLYNVINELSSKAVKNGSTAEEGFSYERIDVSDPNNKNEVTIKYGWRASVKQLTKQVKMVGILGWKFSLATSYHKHLLGWSSDLNSKSYLIHQGRDALTEKLGQFKEKDVDSVNEEMRKYGWLAISYDDHVLFTDTSERNKYKAALRRVIQQQNDELTTSQDNQLNTILDNNVFKATAKIMGDPTLGTSFAPFETGFTTDFLYVNEFSYAFGERMWVISGVKHIFEEGNYTTEVQLITYPGLGWATLQGENS